MKLVIAMMQHETNTFSPLSADYAAFGRAIGFAEPPAGQAVIDTFRGTDMALGAFLDLAHRQKAEVVAPVAAYAEPLRQGAGPCLRANFGSDLQRRCRRLRCRFAGSAWRDGDGILRRRRRRAAAAHSPDRRGRSHRRGARLSHQSDRADGGERHRHHRLPDLSPCRHVRDGRALRPHDAWVARRKISAAHGLGASAAHDRDAVPDPAARTHEDPYGYGDCGRGRGGAF